MQKSLRVLKSVSINGETAFTLKPAKAVLSPTLCDHCACNESFSNFERCWVERYSSDSLSKLGINQEITHCVMHQPIIAFQAPLIGFEACFNTIRPGAAWHSRLRKGVTIGLLDAKKEELFGKAQVISVDVGNIMSMLDIHAANNHLMLSQADNQKDKLISALSRIYGPRIIHDQTIVSVINLKRI